jgi:hypothetical protein
MAAQAQQRGSTIDLELPVNLPIVTIDAARIEQVLLNLLQNALTFTPRGGRITLGAEPQGDQVAIWVRDTGMGISFEDLPHIFERFYKADHARTGGGLGSGSRLRSIWLSVMAGRSRPQASRATARRSPSPCRVNVAFESRSRSVKLESVRWRHLLSPRSRSGCASRRVIASSSAARL